MENIRICHNSQDLRYREPFGAVEVGEKVKLSIYINIEAEVYVRICKFNGEEFDILMNKEIIEKDKWIFSVIIDTSELLGVINYSFKIFDNDRKFYYGNNDMEFGGEGKIYNENPKKYQITVYRKREVPTWYKEGIIYQIFVDRFFNGNENRLVTNPKKNCFIYGRWSDNPTYIKNEDGSIKRWDFYGGNLKGVIKKLSYIKSLGVSIIYMNPIFESVSCHKYDTGDYEKIDSMFGTEDDFIQLCNEAEKLGIKIILDGVFSHTGADSKYFNKFGNYKSIGAYQDKSSPYYDWYRFYEYPNKYESWWGIDNMPNVDELNPKYVDYIVENDDSIIKKWMDLGASGWRLDVADELPDEFIKKIKKKMLSINEESVLIGEVWEDASNKVSYSKRREYLFGKELDSVTNYPLRNGILSFLKNEINSSYLSNVIMKLYENYPRDSFYATMNILGNHDTKRLLTALEENIELFKIAVFIQMTLPGVPLIYYGDEVGVCGEKDPDNRRTYPWDNYNRDILDWYKKISNFRANSEILKKGTFKIIKIHDDILSYERTYNNCKNIILINRSNNRINITIRDIEKEGRFIGEDTLYSPDNKSININLDSHSYKIFEYK